jgi:hypothetical protein
MQSEPTPTPDDAMTDSLTALRADFEARSRRSLSLPIAGLIVWAAVGAFGWTLSERSGALLLVVATGAIFPISMMIARLRGEQLLSNANPLGRLMGLCVVMVNLLWALHVPLLVQAPEYVPLSLGLGLGLHWMVYSWIVGHPVGHLHAILRTVALSAAWWLLPEHRVSACAAAVVLAYVVSIAQMATRPIPAATAGDGR